MALLKYLSALLLFGLNGIVASQIAMGSYEIVFLRTMIGSILLILLFLLGKGRFHLREHRRDFLFILLSGIAMGASWMFLYEAYQQIGVSLASLLYYCGPVIVMVLSPLIFKEKLTMPKVVGFLIVLTGIFLVNGQSSGRGSAWGLFCGAMSAVMYFFHGDSEQTIPSNNRYGKRSDPVDRQLSRCRGLRWIQASIHPSYPGWSMDLDTGPRHCEYRDRVLSVFLTALSAPRADRCHLRLS